MAYFDSLKYRPAISLIVFMALAGVLFCTMPSIDPMHSMPQNCSMANFYNAVPPQNPTKIFLWVSLLISAFIVFVFTKLAEKPIISDDLALQSGASRIPGALYKIVDFLSEGLRRGIVHPKLYNIALIS
jgi:RsiW-degrading membrane proteinase PrsW (M82 family)